ncbi:hypothetical protein KSP40_PGU020729 [Platanthera guangdongensis]|uniref:Uncharacterized protein n=1 Tax=Platanthera guangdongensis TaxID=2320717 RepID=A0ABR2LFE5_9ASPA
MSSPSDPAKMQHGKGKPASNSFGSLISIGPRSSTVHVCSHSFVSLRVFIGRCQVASARSNSVARVHGSNRSSTSDQPATNGAMTPFLKAMNMTYLKEVLPRGVFLNPDKQPSELPSRGAFLNPDNKHLHCFVTQNNRVPPRQCKFSLDVWLQQTHNDAGQPLYATFNASVSARRGSERAECIHREPVCNDRACSTEDNDRFSVDHERAFVLLSSEKTQHKDGMNSDDRERRPLAERRGTDNQFQADFHTEPASVILEPFKRVNHFPGRSPGQLIPQSSMIHVMTNPSICEDDMRIKPGDCRSNSHHRNCDSNIEKGQRMDLRTGPTWSAPNLNGFIPFQQRPPAPKFYPSVQHFPPSLFGARPHMEMNQTRIHYNVHEVADRFPGEHNYSGWHHPIDNSVLPQMNEWDGNSSPFGCKSQPYGRSDWNQNRHLMGSLGETWKGQNPNMFEIPSPREVGDESRNVYPSLESNSEVDHFVHASHAAAQTKQLSDPPYNKSKEASAESKLNSFSQLPKILRDDSKYFCSYLSKIEISTDLIHPELYKEITNLLTSVNSTTIYNVSKDEGAKNNRARNSAKFSNQRKSLPQIAAAATAFKRLLGFAICFAFEGVPGNQLSMEEEGEEGSDLGKGKSAAAGRERRYQPKITASNEISGVIDEKL